MWCWTGSEYTSDAPVGAGADERCPSLMSCDGAKGARESFLECVLRALVTHFR